MSSLTPARAPLHPGTVDPVALTAAVDTALQRGDYTAAADLLNKLLLTRPYDVRLLVNLGGALKELYRFEEAEAVLTRAVGQDPGRLAAWSNLGCVLMELQKYQDSVAAFAKALTIAPTHLPALSGLGVTLRRCGLPREALQFFDQALLQNPDHAETRYYRSLGLLAAGEYVGGFEEYEWRFRTAAKTITLDAGRLWDGRLFPGKTLMIQGEGGLGDMLQFVRYLPLVKARGRTVVMVVPQALRTLFSRMPGVDEVVSEHDALPDYDFHCPIMSLPHRFGTTIDTIPSPEGYLTADPVRVARWRGILAEDARRLGGTTHVRVGLVWAGGKRLWNQANLFIDNRRSTSLDVLAPLAGVGADAVFYSLQVGEASRDAGTPPAGMKLIDHTGAIGDFDDTAALVSLLDLVIAVDTSTAHLAGALGRPVWLLSRYDQCWRWLVGRSDSPWYRSMQVFTQPSPFDWNTPVAAVASRLKLALQQATTRHE